MCKVYSVRQEEGHVMRHVRQESGNTWHRSSRGAAKHVHPHAFIHHTYIVICPFRLVIVNKEQFCGWSTAIPASMHFGTPLAAEGQGFFSKREEG